MPDGDQWQYLETTMLGRHSFDEAMQMGKMRAQTFELLQQKAEPGETWLRRLPVRELRVRYQITPME
jgi:urease accessory protein UreH